jgi:TonB family protein
MSEAGVLPRLEPASAPSLLVELPSWPRVFFGNLFDLLNPRRPPQLVLQSAPAPFWPDVFVKRGLPWRRFLESGGYHLLALALLLSLSRFLALAPQPAPPATFNHAQVIYYQPEEYLPPLDTRDSQPSPSQKAAQKADPEFAPQPVISVPRESDNRSQTIVTPPNIKLKRNVPLPNIVAWTSHPELPIAPAPVVKASAITRLNPQLENSVVAPPPDPERNRQRDLPTMQASVVAPPPDVRAATTTAFQAPQPAVIEPPPSVDAASPRALGDLNIARSSVIAPAPQLSVPEQRAIPGGTSAQSTLIPQVVPPPPSLSGSGSSSAGGRIIALNLHPSVDAPPDPPQGNRRGTFAATPAGHAGASGNPGSSGGNTVETSTAGGTDGHGSGRNAGNGTASGKNRSNGLPSGLYVGSAASPTTSPVAGDPAPKNSAPPAANPNVTASLAAPRAASIPARPLREGKETELSEPEQQVFASRKFYSLTLNMPNLNSAGGTWVIRFAELKKDSASGDLSAPLVMRKVDPAYPLQIMRENVSGTVILYAVIHADGSVGNIRILRSVDDRLDHFASQAVARWQFQPATKNGTPIDVEATFQIPFRPGRPNF